jgi:ABC transport system ATP-binding/permease protein
MPTPLLTLRGVSARWGGRPMFEGVDLVVDTGERLCLVGRNGSGKSTLLQIAAGILEADGGERIVRSGARAAYVPQEPDLGGYATVEEYVLAGLPEELSAETYRVDAVLGELGLDGSAAPERLSGGELRRAALARALAGEPDLLLLDEPTNHLDLPAIEWLERWLESFRGAFVLISHDRRMLEKQTTSILWLDRGVLRRNRSVGFSGFDEWSEAALEEEAHQRAQLEKLIVEETRWSREGIKARRKRNQGRLRRLYDLRAERAAQIKRTGDVKLAADRGDMSGRLVLQAKGLQKSFGERAILRGFSTRVQRGDRIGIIGPNGAGKTTLVRLLIGDLEADAGTLRVGVNLVPLYLDQRRETLDPALTLWDTLVEKGTDQVMVRGRPRHVLGYLQDFLFTPGQTRAPVGDLSGGERNRLCLAKALARPSNLLVLDEPTNDLDIETLEVLQEVLASYEGTLLLVSHDRDFLDKVVTSTIALEGDGEAVEYAGGYRDYLRQRQEAPRLEHKQPKPAARERRARAQTKLSYKQEREADALPAQMAEIEEEVEGIEALLADPDAYARDPAVYQAAVARLDVAKAELFAVEERWLELEVLRESLAAGK